MTVVDAKIWIGAVVLIVGASAIGLLTLLLPNSHDNIQGSFVTDNVTLHDNAAITANTTDASTRIDPFIYQLAVERTKVYLNAQKFGPNVNSTRQLEPVLMWHNEGKSDAGENWTDYIFAYVRQTPLNGKGDVEAIVEFWDARDVQDRQSIQIEANRQAGGTVYMILDGNRIDVPGYTSGFYMENGTVTIYSQGQKTQFTTSSLPPR